MGARRLFAAAIVGLGLLAFAGSAQACSCAPLRAAEALRRSDAAIVARLVKVVPRSPDWAGYRYRVERVYRGPGALDAGDTITVRSGRSATACALPRWADRRYGLFLAREDGAWSAGICSVIAPRRLSLAASGETAGESTASRSCAS